MIISGLARLGRDPEMSYTPKGTAQTKLNMAVKCGYGDKATTMWVQGIVWGGMAELMNNQLSKGMRVNIVAEITGLNVYSKKNGDPGASVDAKILSFEFVDYAEKSESEPEDAEEEFVF